MMERRPRHNYLDKPSTAEMQSDMLAIATDVLGSQFDENDKSRQLWWTVKDGLSTTGLAVTDGLTNYFIYEKAFRSEPRATWQETMGLKRVKFDDNGRKFSIATQAIRSASEEYNPTRPSNKPTYGVLGRLKSDLLRRRQAC